MRGGRLLAVTGVGTLGALALLGAQAPPPSVQVRQTAYLKASNADPCDHFGCGGVLDGHAGYGVAISGDGPTLAVAAPHEASGAKGINGKGTTTRWTARGPSTSS